MSAVNPSSAVRVLRIERPLRRNAVDSATAANLAATLRETDAHPDCRCVILTGAGGWFCAGSDLKELAGRTPGEMAEIESAKADLARAIAEVDLPVIAAVSGYALGGGLSLAAACDYVVADANSLWQMPEVSNGWLPPWGIEPVIRRCGEVAARHVLWGLERLDGARAHALGLVDIVCPPGESLARAEALADSIALLPPLAVKSVKAYQRSPERIHTRAADALASETFQEHCGTDAARLTLARFAKGK